MDGVTFGMNLQLGGDDFNGSALERPDCGGGHLGRLSSDDVRSAAASHSADMAAMAAEVAGQLAFFQHPEQLVSALVRVFGRSLLNSSQFVSRLPESSRIRSAARILLRCPKGGTVCCQNGCQTYFATDGFLSFDRNGCLIQ